MGFSRLTFRQRLAFISSVLYIVLGLIIIVRSVLASVIPLAVLGVVLVALGAVRIRDFMRWRRASNAG